MLFPLRELPSHHTERLDGPTAHGLPHGQQGRWSTVEPVPRVTSDMALCPGAGWGWAGFRIGECGAGLLCVRVCAHVSTCAVCVRACGRAGAEPGTWEMRGGGGPAQAGSLGRAGAAQPGGDREGPVQTGEGLQVWQGRGPGGLRTGSGKGGHSLRGTVVA